MKLDLGGKIALVTGASRGLGRAIAVELASEGCDLFLTARDADALKQTEDAIKAHGRKSASLVADLRQPPKAQEIVDACVREYGRLDVLVNSAGATKRGDFLKLTNADYLDGFALKFHGCVQMVQAAWPHIAKTSGSIVNIVGTGGRNAEPDFTVGGAVNAALMNFTKAIAQRGQKDGVRVNAINPGSIETDRLTARIRFVAGERNISEDEARKLLLHEQGLSRFGRPEEVARLACYLASGASGFIQGSIVEIEGGLGHAI